MGWRFFRRLRIAPGLWLNLSRGGVSLSAGVRGLRATVGRDRNRLTVGLPGTGLSFTKSTPHVRRSQTVDLPEAEGRKLLDKALGKE